jgi:hypothetical protein
MRPRFLGEPPVSLWRADESRVQTVIQFIPESGGPESFDDFLCDLLVANWTSPGGPLSLSADLSRADLGTAEFFLNARLFLTALVEENGASTTATGNLNRAFVGRMFDRLEISPISRQSITHCCKVLNELDLWTLHSVRLVSQCARLVARRKKRFHVTKAGRALLPDDQAGALYHALFLAYFRRFDLCYLELRDVPGIQTTVAAIFWQLDMMARDWTPVRGLAPCILLPGVLNEMHEAMASPHDSEEWILASYLLDPLRDFGLIETRKRGGWPGVTEKDDIRVTALWTKFIHFAWSGAGA